MARLVFVALLCAALAVCGSSLFANRRRAQPGVPSDELNVAAAYFAADNYNPTPTPIPGWKLIMSYRFSLGTELEGSAGHADGFLSDMNDVIIAFRGAVEDAEEWSKKDDSLVYDAIRNPLDTNTDPSSVIHEQAYNMAQKYIAAKSVADGSSNGKELMESVERFCLKGFKVTFTGHSQGGAIATLVAWEAKSRYSTCDVTLITFGSPPIGSEKANSAFANMNPPIKHRPFITKCFDNGVNVIDPITQRYHAFKTLGAPIYLDAKDYRMEFPDEDNQKLDYPVGVLCHFPDNYFDALQDILYDQNNYWVKWCPRPASPRAVQGFEIVKKWAGLRRHHKRLMIDETIPKPKDFNAPRTLADLYKVDHCKHTPTFSAQANYAPNAVLPFPVPPKKSI